MAKHFNRELLRHGHPECRCKGRKKGSSAPAEKVKTMKSNAPWSVKGIERDARETAKEAARREGMTVGEWLNQMIYTAGDPQSSNGQIEGLKAADLVTAIEHLNKRLGEMETASAAAVSELSRNIGGVVERTQRLERIKPEEGTNDDLAIRVERLERSGGDRQRVDALKALEKAVTQVAVQFNNAHKTSLERIDANERQLQELAARIDRAGGDSDASSGVAFLKDAIDGLSTRITRVERIASEAANIKNQAAGSVDPQFVEQTGSRLRVLGDEIKRGGDQIRALEGVVTKLADQIDAAELRSAEGVQKVTETITDLRQQLSSNSGPASDRSEIDAAIEAARAETDARIENLQNSFSDVIGRLENTGDGSIAEAGDAAEDAGATPPLAFDISDDIERMVGDADATPAPAGGGDEQRASEDADEDPFTLDDDDAPAVTADAESEQSDDFSFDFDDDTDDAEASGETEPSEANEARALLSEVQEAFSGGGESKPEETSEAAAETGGLNADENNEVDDDLDSIFADLDALTSGAEEPTPLETTDAAETSETDDETEKKSARATAKALLAGEPASISAEPSPEPGEQEDYLKAARRRAKEAAQRAAEGGKPSRRKLTPKQKAILAARARQKRRAEAQENGQDAATAAPEMATETDAPADGEEAKGLVAKITGALSSISGRFSKNKETVEDEKKPDTGDLDYDDPHKGDQAAFATIKATATARPVTLALGVAIILAAAALFFLVKDLVFKPSASEAPPSINAAQPTITAPVESGTEVVAALPTAPAINPQNPVYGKHECAWRRRQRR